MIPAYHDVRRTLHSGFLRVAVTWLALTATHPASGQSRLYRVERPAMGATFAISLYTADSTIVEPVMKAAFEEIDRIEGLLSDYRPTSELSRINRSAFTAPVTVDPEMLDLLLHAARYHDATDGAFDASVGALVDAWGFRSARPAVPAESELAAARSATGMEHVQIDPRARTVRFLVAGLRLDPGAFGKGYAADRAATLVRQAGIHRALVAAGPSTFRALEPPPAASGWVIRFDTPAGPDSVLLARAGLAISGQSKRQIVLGDATYGHIIDPRSGLPAPAGRLVLISGPTAFGADALATAAYVLGPDGLDRHGSWIRGHSLLMLRDSSESISIRWPPGLNRKAERHP